MYYLDANIVPMFLGEGLVRIYHPYLRENSIVSLDVLKVLDDIGPNGNDVQLELEKYSKDNCDFRISDASTFSLWECMLFNPDNYDEGFKGEGLKEVNIEELLDWLKSRFIISDKIKKEYPLKKTGMFDRRRGTLNEQLGSESLFRKESLDQWWVKQKFNDDQITVKETPYKYIQEYFLGSYYEDNLKGKTILEVGCGTGFHCRNMAQYAQEVIGIDYQKEYIEIATKESETLDNVSFFQADVTEEIKETSIIEKKFDFIFMIDILLFFFSPEFQKHLFEQKEAILLRLGRLLSANGRLIIMDPSQYWLVPRFGEKEAPFGIITEYVERYFKTIPSLGDLSQLFYDTGFAIRRLIEPGISKEYASKDLREYNFIRQFPQWNIFELIKVD